MDWGQFGGIATFAGVLVALGIYLHSHWTRTIEAQVADATYRERLIARHDCKAAAGYYLSLTRLLGWVEGVYGPKLGWRAFNISLTLAFLYPLLAALIGWMVANQTAPGGLEMFQDVPEWSGRLWRSGLLAIGLGIAGWIVARADDWSRKLRGSAYTLLDHFSRWTGLLSLSALWAGRATELAAIVGAVAVAGAFAGVVVGAGAVAGAVAGAIAGSIVMVVGFAGGIVGAVARSYAGLVAGVFAGMFAGAIVAAITVSSFINTQAAALLAFLYFLLPIANALADWLSLAITRVLLADMAQRRPGAWGLAAHLFIDLIAGAVCLALLLAGLVGLLDLWATIHPASLPFDWRAYWLAARADPWQGLALWLMVFTTMVPTLVHAAYSLTLWQAQKSEHTRDAVALIRGMSGRVSDAARNEAASLIRATLPKGVQAALAPFS